MFRENKVTKSIIPKIRALILSFLRYSNLIRAETVNINNNSGNIISLRRVQR